MPSEPAGEKLNQTTFKWSACFASRHSVFLSKVCQKDIISPIHSERVRETQVCQFYVTQQIFSGKVVEGKIQMNRWKRKNAFVNCPAQQRIKWEELLKGGCNRERIQLQKL